MNETKLTVGDGFAWLEALYSAPDLRTPEELAKQAADNEAEKIRRKIALENLDAIMAGKSPNACPRCNGSGYVDYRNAGGICFKCNGVGFLPSK